MPTYDVPGVYIEEVTGPGVIAGVSTSNAAFVGPALAGPLNVALRISSYDEFLQNFGIQQPDGSYWPYITSPRWFYVAHGVRSFFTNGGAQAYIVRIGTAQNTTWEVDDQKNVNPPEAVFRLQAQQAGPDGTPPNTIKVDAVNATGAAGLNVATSPTTTIQSAQGNNVTLDDASTFRAGDTVTDGTNRAMINQVLPGNVLQLSNTSFQQDAAGTKLRIANLVQGTTLSFRMQQTTGLYPGTVAVIQDGVNNALHEYVSIQSVDQVGFVTLTAPLNNTYDTSDPTKPPVITSQEFRITIVSPSGQALEKFDNLSLSTLHPNYVFRAINSSIVNVLPPLTPPTASSYPDALVAPTASAQIKVHGAADNPSLLAAADYSAALDLLRDVEDVNLLVIPDAATTDWQNIQNDMIDHCLLKGDRFAILDPQPIPIGLTAAQETALIETQRQGVQADRGFAALYYPSLVINDPTWKPTPTNATPATLIIPPSGAMAGVYARSDQQVGVHKAPANTDVRGVVGLERRLSDRQQGPLNLEGIDVLRIFPGSGQVTVWGARTTGDPNITDWIYVNVRRLLIYIEQSIEVGIRWAVFEPNGLPLWQQLKRTITEFLTRVWRDGALFGATADQAFYVRIDEALNPPSTRALGRLYIEIGVAPVRPAEFIIVRIGLWDGGAQVTES